MGRVGKCGPGRSKRSAKVPAVDGSERATGVGVQSESSSEGADVSKVEGNTGQTEMLMSKDVVLLTRGGDGVAGRFTISPIGLVFCPYL